jgi:hypothetical protein
VCVCIHIGIHYFTSKKSTIITDYSAVEYLYDFDEP